MTRDKFIETKWTGGMKAVWVNSPISIRYDICAPDFMDFTIGIALEGSDKIFHVPCEEIIILNENLYLENKFSFLKASSSTFRNLYNSSLLKPIQVFRDNLYAMGHNDEEISYILEKIIMHDNEEFKI